MRTQHHFLPELRHWLSGTKCGHATFMSMAFFGHYFYSGTHLVVHQRCFLYSPLLTWFFVFSPPCLTFFISSRNVSESTIQFLRRHKRKILKEQTLPQFIQPLTGTSLISEKPSTPLARTGL